MKPTSDYKWDRVNGWTFAGAPVGRGALRLTKELLHACFNCGCPTREQAALLGLQYPLPAGWLARLCGKEMLVADYDRLRGLRRIKGTPKEAEPELKRFTPGERPMNFEQWFLNSFPDGISGGDGSPHEQAAAKEAAGEAWNDGQQVMLMRAVLRLSKMRKELLQDLEQLEPGTAARAATASACNKLGGLIVELAEMT